jgi:hypothetical protein
MGRTPESLPEPEGTIVRIAYLTLDEVNAHYAGELAACSDHMICLIEWRCPHLGDEYFVLIDFDSLPADRSAHLLTLLARCSGRQAVHGYNIPGDLVRTLRKAGVLVQKRLTAGLFRRLQTLTARKVNEDASGVRETSPPRS